MRPLDPRLLPALRPAPRPLSGWSPRVWPAAGLIVAQTFAVAHLVVVVVHGDRGGLLSAAVLVLAAFVARRRRRVLGEVVGCARAASVGNRPAAPAHAGAAAAADRPAVAAARSAS